MDSFLISMDKRVGDDGREEIQLLQTGLIDRVILALGLDKNSNGLRTPACEKTLPKDSDSDPHDLGFNYANVVRMVMYSCNNSRPNISFAVHQCARHIFHQKREHAEYLKRIDRYLIWTKTHGLFLKPREENIFRSTVMYMLTLRDYGTGKKIKILIV